MIDPYYIDLSQISLDQFQQRLEGQNLLPSRRILHEEIDVRFQTLDGMGIRNMQELHDALKTKKRLTQFAQESGLLPDYLTILRREVNSYLSSPVNLNAFPGIDEDCVAKLANVGIKNSRHLFNQTRTAEQQTNLSQQIVVDPETLHMLLALSDLVRVSGVGPVFAQMLYEVDVQSTADLAEAQAAPLFSRLMELNTAESYTRADFIERDVANCIALAQMLP